MLRCVPSSAVPSEPYAACQGTSDPEQDNLAIEGGNVSPAILPNAGRRVVEDHATIPPRKRQRSEASRVDAAYPRKRAITACRLCRSRKVKCNNARPRCGNCEASKAVCVYEDSQDISSFDPASLLILERLNQVLFRLDQGQVGGPETACPTTSPEEGEAIAAPVIQNNHEAEAQDQDPDGQSDQLHIPSSRTNVDAILQWPIFGGRFPPSYITDTVFELECADDAPTASLGTKTTAISVDEEGILDLVQRFLDLVHIKNPILDVRTLWSYARTVLEDGLKWDAASCLVLIACALGCVATPFPPERVDGTQPQSTSLETQKEHLQQGEAYYNLARRRFGLLDIGILSSQCHFLAGVYNMYVMRPLPAWCQFQSATKSYYLHLKCQAKQPPRAVADPAETSKSRSMEQRLYWSCYKTECEVRAEINLPDSSLADVHYSHMHPSPPDIEDDESSSQFGSSPREIPAWSGASTRAKSGSRRQQEQTWYYYLTEITLRRIANRVLNLFYTGDHTTWAKCSVPFMVKAAEEFEQQLEAWYTSLPPLIQFSDDMPPAEELPYHVRGRVLEIKTWIYAPFLYYAIHSQPDAMYLGIVQPLVKKAITYSFLMMRHEPNRHRHHGTWYGIRGITSACLFILGAVRCGTVSVPEQWEDEIRQAIRKMRYWAAEGPGIPRCIEVLETYLKDV